MGNENRLRIGILFNVSRNWLGGVYYIINLIKSLDHLDESDKPELVVFYSRELKDFTNQLQYSRLTLVPWSFETPFMGYLKSWVKQKNCFSNDLVIEYKLDGIFPEWNQPVKISKAYDKPIKSVSWFADLQHKYYPEFFSKKQWLMREFRLKMMLRNTGDLVVSSKAAENDFKKFYDLKKDLRIHVLNFVSIIDDFDFKNKSTLRSEYKLPDEEYYIVSNQFHKHKNHEVVLKAMSELKRDNQPIHVAITGKMPSDDHSPYIQNLHQIIEENDLADFVHFLGVIPRQDQLGLMKYSRAVLQPSLFEGWSTVIEDAKSLQVPVIASDLEVNIEQLGEKGTYFDPHNEKALAETLREFKTGKHKNLYDPYEKRVRKYADEFLDIFKN